MTRHDNFLPARVSFSAVPEATARRWEALVHALDGVVWEADADTFQYTFISRQVERLLGYPAERWLADPTFWPDHLHPDDRERALEISRRARLDGSNQDLEYRLRAADGRYVWVHDRMTVVEEHGRPVFVCGFFMDVTERRRAEEALRASEDHHRLLAELTSDYAYTCHVTPDGTIEMDSATEGFTRVTGYTLEEIQARGGWPALIHPLDVVGALERREGVLAGGRAVNELRILTKAGATRWIRYSTQPVHDDGSGKPVRLIGAVQDITEYKRVEEELRESAQRLQALSRRLLDVQEQERRHLARELHDEIGQLLTGLKFSVEACGRASADALRSHQQEAQAIVKELTTRVRDLSMRLRPTMLDDLGLLPALLWHFERYTTQTRIQVHFEHRDLDGRFPSEVETAVYRIVQEALTNVARHAGVTEVTVRVWRDKEQLGLQIEDVGHGFDADWVLVAGTSSGLSGMQERAVLLGGYLAVESAPGRGTRVTAELPLGREV